MSETTSPADTPAVPDEPPATPAASPATAAFGVTTSSNPLRDPSDRRLPRVPEPCALVVFGVTGDLARKKLLPAIYDLANRGLLPNDFVLLGFARRDWGDGDFAALAKKSARRTPAPRGTTRSGTGSAPTSSSCPARSTTTTPSTPWPRRFDQLRESHGIKGNAAFYLSIPPSMFPVVLKQMERTGLASNDRSGGWRRVVVEKPFGHDLPSALELNSLVDTVFTAQDVFRIDHYLGKETVQNILALRFANQLFEPVWNSNYVDSVQITMAEDVGIDGRAAFYDATGAARDVLQNHLFQLLALTADGGTGRVLGRGDPHREDQGAARDLVAAEPRRLRDSGQYDQGWLAGERAVAYTQEKDIPADSKTENIRRGTAGYRDPALGRRPFYLRTGKRLPRRVTEIGVLFKKAPHLPFSQTDTQELGHNQLVIRVQPDEGVTLKFGSKVPGTQMEVRDVAMDFLYGEAFHRVLARGVRAADPRRAHRGRDPVPAQRRGRVLVAGDRPARDVLGRHRAAPVPGRRVGPEGSRRDAGPRRAPMRRP